jgi:spermidine synthase
MRFSVAWLLAAAAGALSVSQEILWYRVISYATGGAPRAFAHLLGTFLLGLALGALAARPLLDSGRASRRTVLLLLWLVNAWMSFLGPPTVANAYATLGLAGRFYAYGFAGAVAFAGGVFFPVLAHVSIPRSEGAGQRVGLLYLGNVLGSVSGPLVTTYLLMDALSLQALFALVSFCSLAMALICSVTLPGGSSRPKAGWAALALSCAAGAAVFRPTYDALLEKLHFHEEFLPGHPYQQVVQNRSGIIAVGGALGDDIVYGGGVWDGSFNIDPANDWNGVLRAYAVPQLRHAFEDVLVLGLSSGSWARALLQHPGVRRMQVVEINPGYLELIRSRPEVAPVLADARVAIAIDDGRRWLERHPDARFDVEVMNVSFHWRDHATHVLSKEFMELARRRLKPDGVLYLNATGSEEVFRTAATVFPHVTRVKNMIAASDQPFTLSAEQRRQALLQFDDGEGPLFARPRNRAALDALLAMSLQDEGDSLRANRTLRLVTDDNMLTEYGKSR